MVQTDQTIDCFCCGKQLGNWVYDQPIKDGTMKHVNVHPMGGLHFTTYGHYGSRVFDPMDGKGTTLDVAICDECIIEKVRTVRGTGWRDVHDIAMDENSSYRSEQTSRQNEFLTILEEAMENLDD